MPVIGSSSVTPPGTVIGPEGLRGLTGPAGPAGTGAIGPGGTAGRTGSFVFSGRTEGDNLIVVLSDGTEIAIEGLKGPTGELEIAGGETWNYGTNPVSILHQVTDGITFQFRGITADGTLKVYRTDDVVGISGDIITKVGGIAGGMTENKFSYLSGGHTADSTGLGFDELGTVKFSETGGATGHSYNPEEIVVGISEMPLYTSNGTPIVYGITGGDADPWDLSTDGSTCGDGTGMLLDVRQGSVFKIQTPIGIQGFTGDFSNNEVFNFTIHLYGYDIWDWPENVYFNKDEMYFSCGWDIINFLTNDGGETWKATIASRGYGMDECFGGHSLGSCCYLDTDGENENIACVEYMSEYDCSQLLSPFDLDGDPTMGGEWNELATCAETCGATGPGVCCSEGGNWGDYGEPASCIENVRAGECELFGGTYWTHIYYQEDEYGRMVLIPDGPVAITCDMDLSQYGFLGAYGTLCINPCLNPIACCKDGECIGDSFGSTDDYSTKLPAISAAVCKFVYGGIAQVNRACNVAGEITPDCCDVTIYVGACCLETECDVMRKDTCEASDGIFMGPNTVCDGFEAVDCCIEGVGACCPYDGSGCVDRQEQDCLYPDMFFGVGTLCADMESCPVQPPGACCQGNMCNDGVTQNNCTGSWRGPYSVCCDEV